MKSLEDRFASMLKPRATATDIQCVITEINDEIAQLEARADQSRAQSLDPAVADMEAERARDDERGYRFAVERWCARRAQLEGRLREKIDSDASQAKRQEYDATVAETEALAKDLAQRIPAIFRDLVELLSRIKSNDGRVAAANRSRPGGSTNILGAEQIARGYAGAGAWPNLSPVERLVDMVIPRFDGDGRVWPANHSPSSGHTTPALNASAEAEKNREASKAEFTIQRTDKRQGTVQVVHADGIFRLGFQEFTCWLYPHQVAACRSAGMTITPVVTHASILGAEIKSIGDIIEKREAAGA